MKSQPIKNADASSTSLSEVTEKNKKTFSDFGRTFQEKICQAMILDRVWAGQFSEVVNVEYFEYAYLKKIVSNYLSYYNKYKDFPSKEIIVRVVAEDLKSGSDLVLKDQIKEFLTRVFEDNNLGDLGYVKEKSLDFCKRAALQQALEKSVDLIATEKYESIVDVIKTAIYAGNENTVGIDLTNDVDARYVENYRRVVPTGVPELDQKKILNGGLGAGELGTVVALSGHGKSHLMVHFGANALLQGKNVLHYTFELNERTVGIRYDSHFIDVNSIDCIDHKEEIKKFYADNEYRLGRLKIKYYPTSTITVNTIRSHVEKLASKENFKPDMIIIDYAGIMRSTEKYELLRLELKKIYEELRGLAGELDLPIWTCTQSNVGANNKDYVDMSNMSEAYAQSHICDLIVGLHKQSLQKSTGYGNIFIAKNRAGMDGMKFFIHMDTGCSKIRVVSEEEHNQHTNKSPSGSSFSSDEIEEDRELLRIKIRDINKMKNLPQQNSYEERIVGPKDSLFSAAE